MYNLVSDLYRKGKLNVFLRLKTPACSMGCNFILLIRNYCLFKTNLMII